MRKVLAGVALGAALMFSGSAIAVADEVVEPAPLQTTDYTPDEPTTPSLAGSAAIGDCERDVPWIDYSIRLTDPDSLATTNAAVLVMTNGAQTTEIPLGTLTDNALSGRILWPGASVDAQGNATGWPGWTQNASGQWVETADNFGWTRGDIDAYIRTNPTLAVSLSYPPTTPECAAGPRSGEGAAALPLTGSLPLTGMSSAVLPIGIAGGAVVLAGIVFLVIQNRRRSRA